MGQQYEGRRKNGMRWDYQLVIGIVDRKETLSLRLKRMESQDNHSDYL